MRSILWAGGKDRAKRACSYYPVKETDINHAITIRAGKYGYGVKHSVRFHNSNIVLKVWFWSLMSQEGNFCPEG